METGLVRNLRVNLVRIEVPEEVEQRYLKQQKRDEAMAAVFENKELLQMIVDRAIFNNTTENKQKILDEACNLRLVNYSWLGAVSACFRNRGEPLINLPLSGSNLEDDDEENDRELPEFFQLLKGRSSRLADPDVVAPFKITLLPDFFNHDNFPSLKHLLINFAPGLISLALGFPTNGTMVCLLPPLKLEGLKQLVVNYSGDWVLPQQKENIGCTIFLVKQLLEGASNLEHFTGIGRHCQDKLPLGFENLPFPKTLTQLFLGPFHDPEALETLTSYQFPNLSQLVLYTGPGAYDQDHLYNLLRGCRHTLKKLSILGRRHPNAIIRNLTVLKIPVMLTVKHLQVEDAGLVQLHKGQRYMHNLFPRLKSVELAYQTPAEIRQWSDGSMYLRVKQLVIKDLMDTEGGKKGTITPDILMDVNRAFPNVTELHVPFYGRNVEGLQLIFRQITRLTKLTVELVVDNLKEGSLTGKEWDSLFTGLPVEKVEELKGNKKKLAPEVKLEDDPDYPSIRRLSSLRFLILFQKARPPLPLGPGPMEKLRSSLVSDVAFDYAFLRMPNLTRLRLFGTFRATKKASLSWKEVKGEDIEYVPSWYRHSPEDLI